MSVAEVRVVPVRAVRFLQLAMHEVAAALVHLAVILVQGQAAAVGKKGPRIGGNRVVVADVASAGEYEFEVGAEFGGGVEPDIVGLLYRLRVVPERLGDEVSLVGRQRDGDAP